MGRAATEDIMAHGGAQQGDKTLLDALIPAIEKIELFARGRPEDCLGAVKLPPKQPPRQWIRPRTGRRTRPTVLCGRASKGTVDPGIVAVATVMRAASPNVCGH